MGVLPLASEEDCTTSVLPTTHRTMSGNAASSQTLQSGVPTDPQACEYCSNLMLSSADFGTLRNLQVNELLDLNTDKD